MSPQVKKRTTRITILTFIILVIGGALVYVQENFQKATVLKQGEKIEGIMPVAGLKVGGPFTLTNQDGEKVTEEILQGRYSLIYFGFTYCPAICPTELQKVSRVMSGLEDKAPEASEKLLPVFITIDPQRDTQEVMKDYISLFHPKLIGLTGTVPQINHVKKIYKVFARKVVPEGESEDNYTMDHSSYIYLMSPGGDLLGMYRTKDTADEIYRDVLAKLK